MDWIDIKEKKPEYGEWIIVYRGKLDIPDRWKFDHLPPIVEFTNQWDSSITHWMPFIRPKQPERLNEKTFNEF